MKVQVTVLPKTSVLDPQGVAVRNALHHLDLNAATLVRVGKIIEIELDGDRTPELEAALHQACKDLLSNPVIEDYSLEFLS